MKEERGGGGGAVEGCRSGIRPGSIASSVDIAQWRPRELPADNVPASAKGSWNTHRLGWRVGADFASAAGAGVLVAPVITIIDRAIIENTAGRSSLTSSALSSLRVLLLRPHHFVFSKPLSLIFALYTGTYLTANSIDTLSSTVRNTSITSTTHGTAKFAATSLANLSLCLWKDTHFTRLFSTAAPGPLPPASYALFTLRDCLTIFASFNLPPLLAPRIPMHLLPDAMQKIRSQSLAQFLAPAAVQVLSTPLHLLGLDFYNRTRIPLGERWALVQRAWAGSCLARMGRIIPAFGVGGVVNTSMRRKLMQWLE